MKQQALAGFERYGKATRRSQLLAQMDRVVATLQAVVEPVYPKVGEAGGRTQGHRGAIAGASG